MALKGVTLEELKLKCKSWKVSPQTTNNYITEVRESILKIMEKKNNNNHDM